MSRATLVLIFLVTVAISGFWGVEGDIPRTRDQTHWTVKLTSESHTQTS